jgi:hypothetical protein
VSEDRSIIDRAVELFVYAPVGAGLHLLENAPPYVNTFVERGREEVNQRVVTVRSTGEVALAFGWPRLRKRLQARVQDVVANVMPSSPTPTPAEPAAPAPVASDVAAPPAPPVVGQWHPAATVDSPTSEELPIPGYDALSASQVVERLAGLEPDELDAVQAYEVAHRQRRTILGKIEQLAV